MPKLGSCARVGDEPVRIVHIDTGRELRGGQLQALLLMEGLREAGHECLALARPATPFWQAVQAKDFPVRSATLTNLFQAADRADLLHAHDARAHTLAALTSKIPIIVSRRVAFPPGRSFAATWKYRRAKRFIAVSCYVANQLLAIGIPLEKIDIVYDGIKPSDRPAAWNPSGPVVALATLDKQKGRDLIEQAARIARKPVIFSDALAHDLVGASLFVYITRAEGLGSAALLAMSMGIPVIASRIGGLPEVIVDGTTGILVQNEPEEIASAISRVCEDSRLARSFIEASFARVAGFFSLERLIRGTLACYRRALA
jgi:glycosyltransferase involved in cell wall biosynthesis